MITLLEWNNLQKLIYAKRMLKGSAKQFVSFEKGVTSWKILKRKLKIEFRIKINSATIHNQQSSEKPIPPFVLKFRILTRKKRISHHS